mmetsp:Transcript_26466/g.77147  ORF Transcript_26466/g.77147 Transcript_26466/m.77147 type:complete len:183 (-) Transcript_26466:184-732(-)
MERRPEAASRPRSITKAASFHGATSIVAGGASGAGLQPVPSRIVRGLPPNSGSSSLPPAPPSVAAPHAPPPLLPQRLGSSKGLLLETKPALWNSTTGSHQLNFEWPQGVLEPSRKNQALVWDEEVKELEGAMDGNFSSLEFARMAPSTFQLGKLSEDMFGLIFTAPLSPFQAFACAVTIFET